jgi:hypothetical protein
MLMADVLSITLSILGFLLAQQGLWLISRALWPRRFSAATLRCRRNPVASFVVGVPVTAAWLVLVAVVSRWFGAAGQIASFALFILYWIYANVGTAGFVTHVGQHLASPADEARPWAATVRGGVATELAWLVPFVGWFGVLPVSIVLGAGATTLSLFCAKERVESPVQSGTVFPHPGAAHEPALPVAYAQHEPAEVLR